MHVDEYSFGSIVVDGTKYTQDLKIFPHELKRNWWRDKGHLLQVEDIQDILDYEPRRVIIGQGASGRMKVSDQVKEKLDEHGIDYTMTQTDKAVEEFNQASGDVVGAFHLTC